MALESSNSFVLWGVPRFRRGTGVVYSSNAHPARMDAETAVSSTTDSLPLPAIAESKSNALENPELAACLNGYGCAYH